MYRQNPRLGAVEKPDKFRGLIPLVELSEVLIFVLHVRLAPEYVDAPHTLLVTLEVLQMGQGMFD